MKYIHIRTSEPAAGVHAADRTNNQDCALGYLLDLTRQYGARCIQSGYRVQCLFTIFLIRPRLARLEAFGACQLFGQHERESIEVRQEVLYHLTSAESQMLV
jgi:hypothetical protein